MRRFILVHGMKRSGNHAIIQWMQAQEPFVFCNSIIPIAPILRGKKSLPPPRDFADWLRETVGPVGADISVCASLEDHGPDVRPFRALPAGATQVLILRDAENFFASRIRKARDAESLVYPREPGPLARVVAGWKMYAREFLGQTSWLENKVGVYFGAWFSDPDYRRRLSARLGLEFSDAGFSHVSSFGGGSSFDQTTHDGDNLRMNVLARGKELAPDEVQVLAAILADEELRELGHLVESHSRSQQ